MHTDTNQAFKPRGMTVLQAARHIGVGRSKIYELSAAGKITIKKVDGRSIVDVPSLDALLDNCPRLHSAA